MTMETGTVVAVLVATLLLIGMSVVAMALGVLMKRPCLRGSCGGAAVFDPDGRKISCDDCPNRHH